MIDEKKLIESLKQTNWYAKSVDEMLVSEIDGRIYLYLGDLIEYINNQPKINTWFLCTDRLPDEPRNISRTGGKHEILVKYNALIKGMEECKELYYCGDGYWEDETFKEYKDSVFAWQPLPDSYREDNYPADHEKKISASTVHIMQRFMQRL